MFRSSSFRQALWLALGMGALACGAVYPEVATPVRSAPPGRELEPPPPEDLYFVRFKGAEIPTRTRDGRKWDALGGEAPDPLAKLIVDGKDLIVTPVQSNTLKPTWPDQKSANYKLRSGVKARVELWDSNPINNHPICVKKVEDLAASVASGGVDLLCDSGARVSLTVERAHPKLGLGLFYELRSQSVYVTRLLPESPALRGGLRKGDRILKIMGKDVASLDEGQIRSLINSRAASGVDFTVKHEDGSVAKHTVSEGPIYASLEDGISVE